MKIVVGSTNPVKLEATRAVFSLITSDAEIWARKVDSGVPHQPWGDAQTRKGAVNRARAALQDGINYGVGYEGGLIEMEHGLMTCAWCAVVSESGAIGVGGGVNVMLPAEVEAVVRNGGELGPAMDALIGEHETKKGPGAVGILTDELTDRQRAYEHILIMALARFRRPDLYTQTGTR